MFLETLQRRNQPLIDAAIALHQAGQLPANTYVFDLDAVTANATHISTEARRLGLTAFAMTKQVGRNPDFCRAVTAGGITASVNVDMECARATHRAGMDIGHLGHLVQIPAAEATAAAAMHPAYWTVFNDTKAAEASVANTHHGRDQALLARLRADGDEFYSFQEGGFDAGDILNVADRFDQLPSAHFAGITTFPALLFDATTGTLRTTHNMSTLHHAATTLAAAGRTDIAVNAPGTTSTEALALLAEAGATQVEPGHALTGTTPLHAIQDLPEIPAAVYLSEVSHMYNDQAVCFGGGMYIDPVRAPYQVRAVVGDAPDTTATLDATLPPADLIDYYGHLDATSNPAVKIGDSVVFGFRIQAFITRAYTAGIHGVSTGNPRVEGIWSTSGSSVSWPN